MEPRIRDATADDLARITEIYNQTISRSHISFDTEPYTVEQRRSWWNDRTDPELICLVCEVDNRVVGVAYSSWYRPKAGYRSTVETTVVLDDAVTGCGLGSRLLTALIDRLRRTEVHRVVAIVALPNEASVALHRKLGYREVGTLTEVGTKLGRHWDTTLFELALD